MSCIKLAFCPRLDPWLALLCCNLNERLVFIPRCDTEFLEAAARTVLRAHAAKILLVSCGLALRFRRYEVVGLF